MSLKYNSAVILAMKVLQISFIHPSGNSLLLLMRTLLLGYVVTVFTYEILHRHPPVQELQSRFYLPLVLLQEGNREERLKH